MMTLYRSGSTLIKTIKYCGVSITNIGVQSKWYFCWFEHIVVMRCISGDRPSTSLAYEKPSPHLSAAGAQSYLDLLSRQPVQAPEMHGPPAHQCELSFSTPVLVLAKRSRNDGSSLPPQSGPLRRSKHQLRITLSHFGCSNYTRKRCQLPFSSTGCEYLTGIGAVGYNC